MNCRAAHPIIMLGLCAHGACAQPEPALIRAAPLKRVLAERLDTATAPFYDKLAAGEEAVLVIIGDSISNKLNSYNWHLRALLQNRHGFAGEGYRAFAPGYAGQHNQLLNPPRAGMSLNRSGSYYTPPNDAWRHPIWGPYAPDGRFTIIWDDGKIEAHVYGPGGTLWYLQHPDGGTMMVSMDGVPLATVPTAGESVTMQSLAFETNTPPDETAKLTITTDGNEVIVLGTDTRTGWPGVTYHRVAQGGAGPDLFLFSATPQTAELLSSLEPDLVIVMLDWTGGGKQAYVQEMNELLDYYEQIWPDAGVILQSHHPYNTNMAQESSWLMIMARRRGYGYINLYDLFEDLADMTARGFMDGNVHLSFEGGSWFGHYIDWLLRKRPAIYSTCADWNFDGQVNVIDLAAFSNDWAAGEADVNWDGVTDMQDWKIFAQWHASKSCW